MRVDAAGRAAEDFYRSRFELAVRWAVGLCGDPEAARDIVQDVMTRVIERASAADEPDAYLRRAVVNACHDWRRREQRRARRERLAAASAWRNEVDDPDVIEALGRLPERQRSALVLRHWAGWPDDEIAAALGCRPTTVRVLVHRGLRHLRNELTEES